RPAKRLTRWWRHPSTRRSNCRRTLFVRYTQTRSFTRISDLPVRTRRVTQKLGRFEHLCCDQQLEGKMIVGGKYAVAARRECAMVYVGRICQDSAVRRRYRLILRAVFVGHLVAGSVTAPG